MTDANPFAAPGEGYKPPVLNESAPIFAGSDLAAAPSAPAPAAAGAQRDVEAAFGAPAPAAGPQGPAPTPTVPGERKKNWPICCPFQYHDIAEDIPPEYRKSVRAAYTLWYATVVALWLNLVCVIILYKTDKPSDTTLYSSSKDWLYGLAYAVFGTVGSWYGWYRGLYLGLSNNASSRFTCFFLLFFAHVSFSLVATIGVPGTSGIIGMVHILKWRTPTSSKGGAVFFTAITWVLWFLVCVLSGIFLFRFHKEYKSKGQAHFQRVKHDLAAGAMQGAVRVAKSDAFRDAASDAATAAMNNPQVRQAATKAAIDSMARGSAAGGGGGGGGGASNPFS